MSLSDFPQNLKLLCSYGRSVSDVCRRIGINRQQFNRYLSGASKPSLHTVRRLCDFFSVEDHEIFLDHAEFAELIRLRPPRIDQPRNPLHGFVERLCQLNDNRPSDWQKYLGYYFYYLQQERQSGKIYRSLAHIYEEGGQILSRQIERYPDSEPNLPKVMRYEGIVAMMSGRLVLIERQEESGLSVWQSVFLLTDYNPVTFLSGLSLGINPYGTHDIVCCRSILEYLGRVINLRDALSRCGGYDESSSEISDYVRHCVHNDLPDDAEAMMPRY